MSAANEPPPAPPPMVVSTESTLICAHGGSVSVRVTSQRVTVDDVPVVTQGDLLTVSSCPFTLGTSPAPCVMAQVVVGALRVTVEGRPLVTTASTILTTGVGPPVPVLVTRTQSRVSAQ